MGKWVRIPTGAYGMEEKRVKNNITGAYEVGVK
jgi:hypothetical protein